MGGCSLVPIDGVVQIEAAPTDGIEEGVVMPIDSVEGKLRVTAAGARQGADRCTFLPRHGVGQRRSRQPMVQL